MKGCDVIPRMKCPRNSMSSCSSQDRSELICISFAWHNIFSLLSHHHTMSWQNRGFFSSPELALYCVAGEGGGSLFWTILNSNVCKMFCVSNAFPNSKIRLLFYIRGKGRFQPPITGTTAVTINFARAIRGTTFGTGRGLGVRQPRLHVGGEMAAESGASRHTSNNNGCVIFDDTVRMPDLV